MNRKTMGVSSAAAATAIALLSAVVVAPGCGGSSSPSLGADAAASDVFAGHACVPGEQVACACAGAGPTGAQTCAADGQSYGACIGCSVGEASVPDAGGGASDSSAGVDARSIRPDGGTSGVDGSLPPGGVGFDGTSGRPCESDAECVSVNGPGTNQCSIDFTFIVTSVVTQLVPTPICIVPPSANGNCDPAPPSDPQGQGLHFCDGPDVPTSPGICFPLTNPPESGVGTCLPACTFALDGSKATGCIGKDTCFPFTVGIDANNNATGWGYCQGSCQSDADCSALGGGYVCQTDIGACTTNKVVRTKKVGAACSADPSTTVGNDNATGACNCLPDNTTNAGYCTTACVVGGSPCPNGWKCDTLQPNEVPLPDGMLLVVAKENTGTAGVCMPPCSGTSSGPACPTDSTCEMITPAGPDCVP